MRPDQLQQLKFLERAITGRCAAAKGVFGATTDEVSVIRLHPDSLPRMSDALRAAIAELEATPNPTEKDHADNARKS